MVSRCTDEPRGSSLRPDCSSARLNASTFSALGNRAEHVVLDEAVGALDAALFVAFRGGRELDFERQSVRRRRRGKASFSSRLRPRRMRVTAVL